RVGEIDLPAVDARALEVRVEHAPGRPDERAARHVLLVAGLLADDHQLGLARPLSHHRAIVEQADRAAATGVDRLVDALEALRPLTELDRTRFDHRALPRLRTRHELGDERGFGHVLPVLAGHLLEHRPDL